MGPRTPWHTWMGDNIMHILVLCPTESGTFGSVAQACYNSFITLGHEVKYATEYEEGYDVAFFVSFNHKWRVPKITQTLKVGYHFEQLPWGANVRALRVWFDKFRRQQMLYDYIVDISYNNVLWLKKSYPNVFWCALGYHSIFEVPANKASVASVRFIGSLECPRHRRLKMIRYINSKLQDNFKIQVEPVDFSQGTYGADVHLNLHNYPQNSWEAHRTIQLMCNRQFVLTEKIDDHHPFENRKHWVEADWKDMPYQITYYLEHSEERNQIAEEGYKFIKEKYNFATHLQRLISELTSIKKEK